MSERVCPIAELVENVLAVENFCALSFKYLVDNDVKIFCETCGAIYDAECIKVCCFDWNQTLNML